MMIEEIKRLYEDLKINVKTKKGIKEGKVQKYDATLLKSMIDFDYYNIPMIYSLFNPGFKEISLKEVSLGFAKFLRKRGLVNLVRSRANNYYLLELRVGQKTYIYDVLTKFVYDKDTYYEINSDVPYVKLVSSEKLDNMLLKDAYLISKAEESDVRTELVASSIADYQNGESKSLRTENALDAYVRRTIILGYARINDFDRCYY